jgi:uracil-DNA glycosylase
LHTPQSQALPPIPPAWRAALAPEIEAPWFADLSRFLEAERGTHQVFPPRDETFAALALTPLTEVRVVILGQDPYHDEGQAHGLAFSVRRGVRPPPSLANIFKELEADVGARAPGHGDLTAWARRGVLLLNAVLTVRAHEPNSHRGHGWERFTDAVLRQVAAREAPVVFVLWGAYAQKKAPLVDGHPVITGAHPSPLSARNGFFGSRPFSRVNEALRRAGEPPVDWQL